MSSAQKCQPKTASHLLLKHPQLNNSSFKGKFTNHKGRNRRFTNPEELEEERRREEQKKKWRQQQGDDSSSEEEASGDKKISEEESGSDEESTSEDEVRARLCRTRVDRFLSEEGERRF